MKKLFINARLALLGVAMIASTNACTDLTEKLYSEIPSDQFYQTQDQINGAIAAVYTGLAGMGNHGGYWSGQENSSQESLIPQRGGDWYDGGQWLNAAQHITNPNDGFINGAWSFAYKPIATCNRLIAQLPTAAPTTATIAVPEIRAMRALYYYFLLDQFGNVPLYVNYPVTNDEFATRNRADVYAFIQAELSAVLPSLNKAVTYGKMNYYSAKALQARLYLNAGVYTGTPDWANAKAAADEVIKSNVYKLDLTANWIQNNFWKDNDKSVENIFVVPYDEVNLQGFNFHHMALHYASQATFNLQAQPWNGYCTLQEFYNSYEASDIRKANFFAAGPQFAADGKTPISDGSVESNDPDGPNVNFTPEINQLFPNTLRQAGVRMLKFRPYNNATSNLSNDFPVFRMAEMYLTRAEASFRLNPADATALADVNAIRTRAGVAPFTALTATNLLAERGREMAFEGVRRPDEIRFGVYSNARQVAKTLNKPADDDATKRTVYPIPQPQLDANPKLRQNTGY